MSASERFRGRLGYWRLRRREIRNALLIRLSPAMPPSRYRCCMGSVISEDARCRFWTLPGELWCPRCARFVGETP